MGCLAGHALPDGPSAAGLSNSGRRLPCGRCRPASCAVKDAVGNQPIRAEPTNGSTARDRNTSVRYVMEAWKTFMAFFFVTRSFFELL